MQNTTTSREGYAWPIALAAAAFAGTLASACMMPFVAIAVATAATMTRGRAALTIGGIWAINQLLGFGLLGYPLSAFAIGWGVALGGACLLALVAAASILGGRQDVVWRLLAAFIGAFVIYEGGLFLFALLAGGTGTFTAGIIGQIAANDGMWFAGLIALHLVLTRAAPGVFGRGFSVRLA